MSLWSTGVSMQVIHWSDIFTFEKIVKLISFNLIRHPHNHTTRDEYKSNPDDLRWLYASIYTYQYCLHYGRLESQQ